MTPTTDHRMDIESPPGTQTASAGGVTETARDEAGQLKETSAEAARQVAETAKEKASDVTSDVRRQTQELAGQTRDQLVEQARQQKDRAADGMRSVSEELRGMAENGQSGWASQLARQGADLTDQAADFLQKREPGDLLEEVRVFARRRPGAFLLTAAVAGVVAGRLTRALAAGSTGTPSSTTGGRSTAGGPMATDTGPTGLGSTGMSAGADPTGLGTAGTAGANGSFASPVSDEYLASPSAPPTAPPVEPTTPPPPTPTPVAPDPDPGAPVTPRFGPGSEH
jgi:hypothetical protein